VSATSLTCAEVEPLLPAVASSEADAVTSRRVESHLVGCSDCRAELARFRAIEGGLSALRDRAPVAGAARSLARLEVKLADLRHRLVRYRIFPSPFGSILLARSEEGVLLVEYLGRSHRLSDSRLTRVSGIETAEDGHESESLFKDLRDYLAGKRTRLDWPLDLRLVHSQFHRSVLEKTAAIPYGAVESYAGVAAEIGRPKAVRAAAQALRWNPLPIVIPCHRVIGSSGALTGYAGGTTEKKKKLLAIEGVRTVRLGDDFSIRRDAMYILQPGEEEYCLPTCPSVKSLRLGSKLFASRSRAEETGLRPCTTCRPDLHPLS
jgi:methylated-DNA-[protein]-cysteine S-methyltransferase